MCISCWHLLASVMSTGSEESVFAVDFHEVLKAPMPLDYQQSAVSLLNSSDLLESGFVYWVAV